jgi:hypothetical protein
MKKHKIIEWLDNIEERLSGLMMRVEQLEKLSGSTTLTLEGRGQDYEHCGRRKPAFFPCRVWRQTGAVSREPKH